MAFLESLLCVVGALFHCCSSSGTSRIRTGAGELNLSGESRGESVTQGVRIMCKLLGFGECQHFAESVSV